RGGGEGLLPEVSVEPRVGTGAPGRRRRGPPGARGRGRRPPRRGLGGVGGLVSAVFAGPLKHTRRHGLVMLACVAVWGGGFALFAVAPSLWLTLLALAIAGLADTFTVVMRSTIVQEAAPDAFLGRVNAADFLVGAGGSQLGSLEAGLVGSWTTPVISALSGGLLTVAGAVAIGAALPGFLRYRS